MDPIYTQDVIVYPLLQHSRGTQPLTPQTLDALTLATYLGSWHHSDHTVRGVPEAHPGDDRTRAAVGWDQERLEAAGRTLRAAGLWRRYASPSTVEGWAWTLIPDLALVKRLERWYGRSKPMEAALKCLVRGTPDLSPAARIVAVILATRFDPREIAMESAVIGVTEMHTLLPGVDLGLVAQELLTQRVLMMRRSGSRQQFISASLHSAFLGVVQTYMGGMGRAKRHGMHGETLWEREVFTARGEVVLNRAQTLAAQEAERKQYFYLLRDPRTTLRGSFYGGITHNPEDRARSHKEAPLTGDGQGSHWSDDNWESNPAKRAQFERTARDGYEVHMEVITEGAAISEQQARDYERMIIQGLYVLGLPLTNIEYVRGARLPRLEDAEEMVACGLRGFGLDDQGVKHFFQRIMPRRSSEPRNAFTHESQIVR